MSIVLRRVGNDERPKQVRSARAREDATRLADAGDFDSAQRTLSEHAQRLRASGSASLAAEAEELEVLGADLAAELYTPLHRKHLHFQSWQSRQGRRRSREEQS